MLTTWIETAATGRLGGPIRAGMWGTVVLGTHPADREGVEAWLELIVDDESLGLMPAYWLEDKGVNSLWHAPLPPRAIGARLRYRAVSRRSRPDDEAAESPWREAIVRPNLPDRTEPGEPPAIGLVGNRRMTARVDPRGATFDVFFPSIGLHSDVRPAEGDLPHSRAHFRSIVGGLGLGQRLDWFVEPMHWEASQRYRGETNLLETTLRWRRGPIRVVCRDFMAMGPDLPRTGGGLEAPGQYLKRYRIINDGPIDRRATFGLFVQAEVNGGIGEPSLGWQDLDACLLAANRGHWHSNRKLARDATVEFALALDGNGPVDCETTGPTEAMMLRSLELPAGSAAEVDVLVSGAFTGWRADLGTFEHWLRPALAWFRSADLDAVERGVESSWRSFADALPIVDFPRAAQSGALRRSGLAAALHCDAEHGSIAAGFDRGLNAYCWPRDALWAAGALTRAGHPEIGAALFGWLGRVRGTSRCFAAWFMKYTIDGVPEWETPAIDQSAMIPWALLRHVRRTGDLELAERCWPIVERAARVCMEGDAHPGLRWLGDLRLMSSAGLWETRFGAYLFSNAAVVAGLRAASELAGLLDRPGAAEHAGRWSERARLIWDEGILAETVGDGAPGLVDARSGRFLEGRRLALRKGFWSDRAEDLADASGALDIGALGPVVPFGLLPASDPRARRTAGAILVHNLNRADPDGLTRWAPDPSRPDDAMLSPSESHRDVPSCLATFWMARYLLELGRATGEARHWSQAVEFLDRMLARLGPLGISMRPKQGPSATPSARCFQGIWGLHAMLIEAMQDLAGLDYDALDRRILLRPALPTSWPRSGIDQELPCGRFGYRLDRPVGGGAHRLRIDAELGHAARLDVEVTCPGLSLLGPWSADPPARPPRFDPKAGRLSWSLDLPPGRTSARWSWGEDASEWVSAV